MEFEELFLKARNSDQKAMLALIEMYRPLMIKYGKIDNVLDEDLYQEFVCVLILCVKKFPYKEKRQSIYCTDKIDRHKI